MEAMAIKSNKLLVIGGTGFIGRYVVREALKRNFTLTVLSFKEVAKDSKVEHVQYIQADTTNFGDLETKLTGIEFNYVINLGGYIDHSNFKNGGRKVIDDHYESVLNITEILNWESLKSFLQVGSSNEYGSNSAPQKEDDRERPFSPYSLAKVTASQTLQMLNQVDNFPAIIIRIFLVYGPGQSQDRFIPQIIEGCVRDENFETSSGLHFNDFTYVEDIASGIMDLLICKDAVGEVVNLASGKAVRVRSIVEKVCSIVGKGNPIYGSLDRPVNNPELYADITKAKKLINWKPRTSLDEGLKLTINSFKL